MYQYVVHSQRSKMKKDSATDALQCAPMAGEHTAESRRVLGTTGSDGLGKGPPWGLASQLGFGSLAHRKSQSQHFGVLRQPGLSLQHLRSQVTSTPHLGTWGAGKSGPPSLTFA